MFRAGLLMKFTFASLMLLLVHAVMGVPLAAQSVRDSGLAEIESSAGRPDALVSATVAIAKPGATQRCAFLAETSMLVVARTPSVQLSCAADMSDLPLHWGTGDRHAWDEGKP